MGYSLSNKTIDRYLSFLTRLDSTTKKRLIKKLNESIEPDDTSKTDVRSLFGAWEDSKDTDTIIKEIREARVEKMDQTDFE